MGGSESLTHPIAVNFDGWRYRATYTVESNAVQVHYEGRHLGHVRIGGMTAEFVARVLFRELLASLKASGRLPQHE
jgi:hypothetical protein